ncbi:MAG TPA: hypothetical protein VKA46_10440 [Gemmataceae bacterium]|nr:hypothetical protein [Gemmataceae bacterium]
MAFNPFHSFRKRQKTLLAILTIFVMFIFILSYSGSGDALSTLMAWLGAGGVGQKDKTEVTKLYGKTITVGDLAQLRQHRHVADTFIQQAVASAAQPTRNSLGPDVHARLQVILSSLRFGGFSLLRQRLREYQVELLNDGKKDAATQVGNINRGLGLEEWRISHPGDLYFGGTLAAESLLDFLVWRQQADRLNITLTDDDVRREINGEASGEVLTGGAKDAAKIASLLQGGIFRQIDQKQLFAALRDEFRVRLAQDVLLGNSGGARSALGTGLAGDQVPAGSTPEQFWEFYKNNRTELKVDFLKIPVSQFSDKVKEQPTRQELEDLFKRHKNDEPDPARPAPGFKVPRKVKVEWVEAHPEAPHYREVSAQALPLLTASEPLTLLTLPQTMAGSPGGVAGACAPMSLASLWNAPLRSEYDSYAKGIRSWWDASNITPEGDNPYATGLRRTDTRAAVLGQVLGSAATGAPLYTAVGTQLGSAEVHLTEQKAREVSMILAGANPSPLAVLTQEAALANIRVPPLAAVRDDMASRIRGRIAPQLAQAALDAFIKEVEAKRFTPKEVAEYVTKNANLEHGITRHEVMPAARDRLDIADAPALAPLKRAKEGKVELTPSETRQFAAQFFEMRAMDGRIAPLTLYKPEPLRVASTEALYYFWLTQSDPSYVPKFEEVEAKVEAAWKFDKARKLARAKAQQIVDAIKDRGEGISADRFLKDEAYRLQAANPAAGYERFEVPALVKLDKKESALFSRAATRYEPFKFDKYESEIPYPRDVTVAELFEALTKPDEATIIRDRPDRNYYVALLEERRVPTEGAFLAVYREAPRGGDRSDSLWERFQLEREQHYRTEMVQQMRRDAKAPLDELGNYRIDPEVRRTLKGALGSEE